MARILIIEDEESYRDATGFMLRKEGFEVLEASDGAAGLALYDKHGADLVLLDVMMPGLDGIGAADRIRQESNVPIIFVSAKGEESDRILGLHAGADDYIVKPFSPAELFARIRSALRRYTRLGGLPSDDPGRVWRTGALELDDDRKAVQVNGAPVTLTALEFGILRHLIANQDRVFSSAQIYEAVWREPAYDPGRTVAVHVRHIREKIEADPSRPRYLRVVHGLGYKVVALP